MSESGTFMLVAVDEAEFSLREGNCGFGAVIVRNGEIVAKSHDTEKTDRDPTAYAELTVIRKAAAVLGRHLTGCQIVRPMSPARCVRRRLFGQGSKWSSTVIFHLISLNRARTS